MAHKLTWALERHAYAPELNELHILTLRGKAVVSKRVVSAPGVATKEGAEALFRRSTCPREAQREFDAGKHR